MTTSTTGDPGERDTPLASAHQRAGATMTSFAGWRMPLRYASETAEHQAVRRAAGLFDLSHMGEIEVAGPEAAAALDYALTGQPSVLADGRARYTMICAADGGVLDDLVVYRRGPDRFWVIANASNRERVAAELASRAAGFGASVTDQTLDWALIAVQGPAASAILAPLTGLDLDQIRYYSGTDGAVASVPSWVARTGYTGEDGFEIYCPADRAGTVWDALLEQGAPAGLIPAGLSARDTLRLEAGMPLYGNELGPDLSPFEANLGRVVTFSKPGDFVGREALAARAGQGPDRLLAGLTITSRRVPRHGYPVLWSGKPCGVVTSGAPSPTLGVPIALAYLDRAALQAAGPAAAGSAAADTNTTAPGPESTGPLAVDIRGTAVPAVLTELPFYRRSK